MYQKKLLPLARVQTIEDAIMCGDVSVVESVVTELDFSAVNRYGMTPLELAITYEQDECAAMMLRAAAPLELINEAYDDSTVPHELAGKGMVESLRCIRQLGGDIEAYDANGMLPLDHAIREDQEAAVRYIVSQRADINMPNQSGETPMHMAASIGASRMLKLLRSLGGDIEARSEYGSTPLHRAVGGRRPVSTLITLLEMNADPNAVESSGYTPLMGVVRNRDISTDDGIEMIRRLMAAKANPKLMDINGSTALHSAAAIGESSLVEAMVQYGANPIIVNSQRQTLWELGGIEVRPMVTRRLVKLANTPIRRDRAEKLSREAKKVARTVMLVARRYENIDVWCKFRKITIPETEDYYMPIEVWLKILSNLKIKDFK